MTSHEAEQLFRQAQADYATAERRKGEAYRQWTTIQAAEKQKEREARGKRYQAKRDDGGTVENAPETVEERTERIINEQHEKNMRLQAEGKW